MAINEVDAELLGVYLLSITYGTLGLDILPYLLLNVLPVYVHFVTSMRLHTPRPHRRRVPCRLLPVCARV
jgi:hypothetical protein